MSDDAASLGVRLKAARDRAGLSAIELGVALGVNKWTIYSWENESREPSFATLKKIARALGVTVAYLAAETDDMLGAPEVKPAHALPELKKSDEHELLYSHKALVDEVSALREQVRILSERVAMNTETSEQLQRSVMLERLQTENEKERSRKENGV